MEEVEKEVVMVEEEEEEEEEKEEEEKRVVGGEESFREDITRTVLGWKGTEVVVVVW